MNKQEQLEKVNDKIRSVLDQMEKGEGNVLVLYALFTKYMDRRQELMKEQ